MIAEMLEIILLAACIVFYIGFVAVVTYFAVMCLKEYLTATSIWTGRPERDPFNLFAGITIAACDAILILIGLLAVATEMGW